REYVETLARGVSCKEQPKRISAFAGARLLERGAAPGIPAAVIHHRRIRFDLYKRPVFIEDLALHHRARSSLALLELLDHLRRLNERDHVVHHLLVAGYDLGGGHPLVFFEVCRNDKGLDGVGRPGLYRELLTDIENGVRFAELPPTSCAFRSRRKIPGIPFTRSAVNPRNDCVRVLLRQAMIVLELAGFGFRAPRWHLPVEDLLLDRPGPRTAFLVGDQRHRSDVVRAMTLGAVLVEDRRNVAVESDILRRRAGNAHSKRYQADRRDCEQSKK